MLERERDWTCITTSIVDCHALACGSQEKIVGNIIWKGKEECLDLIILTPTCTSSILQENLQYFVNKTSIILDFNVILVDVNHYWVNELQAMDKTFEQIVRYYLDKTHK